MRWESSREFPELIKKSVRSVAGLRSDYDRNANDYDRIRFGTVGGQYVSEKEQQFVASIIRGSRVLEVGTATGRFAVSLTHRGADYIGIDVSQKMLQLTRYRTNRSASVIQMDGTMLGFTEGFDYVLCIRTFHFLPEPLKAVRGMYDSLKPGGKCLITFETDNILRRLVFRLSRGSPSYVSNQSYYRKSEVEQMFSEAGFKAVKSGNVMRIPVIFYRNCPGRFLWVLKLLETTWPWSTHDYVLGTKVRS